jgi:RNA polymerase sigma-70 factor (ECF subfamily)
VLLKESAVGGSISDGEFDRFVELEQRGLIRQAYVLTGDAQEAQDLTQETLVRAWRQWDKVSTLDNPAAWARHVLHNLAVSSWRRRRTRHQSPAGWEATSQRAAGIGHLDIAAAVRALPTNQRNALIMRTVLGMSAAEIATELDTTEATVRSWLSRARREVAMKLGIGDPSPLVKGGGRRERTR